MMMSDRITQIRRVIEKLICQNEGELSYIDLARALHLSPSYASQILRVYCPSEYKKGICTCDKETLERICKELVELESEGSL